MNVDFIELVKNLLYKYGYRYMNDTIELSFNTLLSYTSLEDGDITRIINFMNKYFESSSGRFERTRIKEILDKLIIFQRLNQYNLSILNLDIIEGHNLIMFQKLSESFLKNHYSWIEENRYSILIHQVIPESLLPKDKVSTYRELNYKISPKENISTFPKYLRGFKYVDNKLLGFKCGCDSGLLQKILSVESMKFVNDVSNYFPVLIDPLDIIVDTELMVSNYVTYIKFPSNIIKLRNDVGGLWRLLI